MAELSVVMSAEEVTDFLDRAFQQKERDRGRFVVTSITPGEAEIRFEAGDVHLRPGGTVSGPTMFALADVAAYAIVLGHVGPKGLAVTTNLNINFMRKPEPGVLIGKARLLKLGTRLAVTDCEILSGESGVMVAHATATYSIPAGEA